LTALLIICKEKNIPSLRAFEEELLIVICCAPSYSLSNEIISAGTFCWSWISVIPELYKGSLYLNMRYSFLVALNTGGIFESNTIQSSLIPDAKYDSLVLEFPKSPPSNQVLEKVASGFIKQMSKDVIGDAFSALTCDEHNYNLSRDALLGGFDSWLRFLRNQLKVLFEYK